MQLSGLLEKLKGLFSTALLISSVLPLFCFVLVNAAILTQYSETVRAWLQEFLVLDTGPKTVAAAFGSLGLLVLAYVFSTFNLSLREVLEGKQLQHLAEERARKHPLRWVALLLEEGQVRRRDQLDAEFDELRHDRDELDKRRSVWEQDLIRAREVGVGTERCGYTREHDAHKSLTRLFDKRLRGERITVEDLNSAVAKLGDALAKNSANLGANTESRMLDQDQDDILKLIDYVYEGIEPECADVFNEREFNFSRFSLKPTQMGNIAESVRGYTQSRYGMNLDFFWTRFQKVLQDDAAFYQTLQDAKTQLDFAVSMFWLTAASWVIWVVALPFVSHTWLPLICAWVAGPLLVRVWYLIALQNYRPFADLLRSAVDLFRFKLLVEFRIPLSGGRKRREADLGKFEHQILLRGRKRLRIVRSDPDLEHRPGGLQSGCRTVDAL